MRRIAWTQSTGSSKWKGRTMADKTQEYYLSLHYRVEFEFDPDENLG